MGRIRPHQPWLAGRRSRFQITADIPHRQSQRPQAGNGKVRKILTNPPSFFQHRLHRRGNGGRGGIKFKIPEDPPRQIACGRQQRTPRGKAQPRIISQRFTHRHLQGGKPERLRLEVHRRRILSQQFHHFLPRRRRLQIRHHPIRSLHHTHRLHRQFPVSRLLGKKREGIPERIHPLHPHSRHRINRQFMTQALLPGIMQGPQPRQMMRLRHLVRIIINRAMPDQILHPPPCTHPALLKGEKQPQVSGLILLHRVRFRPAAICSLNLSISGSSRWRQC